MSETENYELVFEDVATVGSSRKRIGKAKATGLKVLEIIYDEQGREIEKLRYNDDGTLNKRVVYVRDQSRKPLLTSAYDATGKLIFRQERGKRPELFE